MVSTSITDEDASLSWLQRRSFGTQLAWVLALVVAVLVVALTAAFTSMMRSQIERDKGAALASLGRSITTALGKNLRDRMQQVEMLAQANEVWSDGLASPTVASALDRMKAMRPFPSWVGVADSTGTVVAATGGLLVGKSVKERPWFPAGIRGRYVGDVHEAKLLASLLPASATGEPIRFVDFAVPLKQRGSVVGVVGLHADVEGVKAIAEAFLPKNASARSIEVYILTRTGEVIFGNDRRASLNLSDLTAALAAIKPTQASEQGRPAVSVAWGDGHHYLTTQWALDDFASELQLGWQVLVRQPIEVAYAPAAEAARKGLFGGLIAALFAVAAGLALGRQLTAPLRRMARAAKGVAKGNQGALIPRSDQNQDLSDLSRSLQSMTLHLERLVTERTAQLNEANHELRALGEEQRAMLDNELVGIVRLNMQSRSAVWNNRAMAKIFGYSMEELSGQSARLLYGDEATYEKVGADARVAFSEGCDYIAKVQMQKKDGSRIWIHLQGTPLTERPGESLWMMTDVTSQHLHQERVEHIAFHDSLTGLPNRLLLSDRISQSIVAAQRSGQRTAVAFLDLDGFKAVNDRYGHEAGDCLLKEIASRATAALRAEDTVARLGGDEFVLVIGALTDCAACDQVLQRLMRSIAQPVHIDGNATASVAGSVGVAFFPDDGEEPATLLAAADAAMYLAKKSGKGKVCYASGDGYA